eukprot:TRINITY_DN3940_c0_g1_i2.p1 TRINITY_DN3940_c0_g1~~TRINITY_DN3940_c0_g1_i2.p1  ORF type:complete len:276 (-),score=25.33 TRINITY_DN3940_c0_g1_i2:113-940(-)
MDTLTCQSYFNPHIVTILQQILTGGKQSNAVIRAICDHTDLKQSNLWQIPVPEDYLSKTFGDLFNYLTVERNLIPLAIYRLPGAQDNRHPYVYTNPPAGTKLTHRDKVFVLAFNMPNDLLNGVSDRDGEEKDGRLTLGAPRGSKRASLIANPPLPAETIAMLGNNNTGAANRNFLMPEAAVNQSRGSKMKGSKDTIQVRVSSNLRKIPGKASAVIDLESMNPNSATFAVLEEINSQINDLKEEISLIKSAINQQDETLIEKVKAALRQEIATISQ